MNDAYESLQGQVEALSLVLTSIITSMPGDQARIALGQLKSAFDRHCSSEHEDRRRDLTRTLTREALVESYLGLLEQAGRSP